jgi:TRAP-type C4-dicarboxylate transport system substrate-binding protein
VNLDKWNKIPKDLQDVLLNAAIKIENLCLQKFPEVAQDEFAVWKKAGMHIWICLRKIPENFCRSLTMRRGKK